MEEVFPSHFNEFLGRATEIIFDKYSEEIYSITEEGFRFEIPHSKGRVLDKVFLQFNFDSMTDQGYWEVVIDDED